nr:ABC transporter ATP-binding protein [Ignavibacteriota bacterium]
TSLNPVFKCGDQIMESIILHEGICKDQARERALQLMKEVQLPRPEDMMNQYPHQLSGGQKQRVMIAMAMSCNPALLIADEPTTALDVTVQSTILDLMHDLQKKHNMGMMFITHDLGVIKDIADDIIVMYKGKIVEQGSVAEIRMDKKLHILPTVRDFMDKTADGIITPKELAGASINDVIESNVISREEVNQRNAELSAQKPILSVKNLEVHFPIRSGNVFGQSKGVVKAVDDISFDVYPGETLGLVGESGCGKTTTGRAILRLVEPTGGDIEFAGKDIRELSKGALKTLRKDFQIIFQDPYSSLNPRLSVGSAIMEVLKVHNVMDNDAQRREYIHYLLDKVNLEPHHYGNYPHEFSGGQRQRICIARALALKPSFLICDESVSALDVSVQSQVLNLLVKLREEFKLTYIFISHDLSVVKFISDRIAVMNAGKIIELGTAQEIYESPKNDYTRRLIESIPGTRTFQ